MAEINGGKKLEEALTRLVTKVKRAGTLRVGFLRNATYPDGKPVAFIAALNDFGTSRMPPRPFFRNMVAAKSKEWPAALGKLLKANDYDAEAALIVAGSAIAGQLRQSIIDTNAPPLAPSTVKRKGFAKPLVDTGHMLNSVSYEVK